MSKSLLYAVNTTAQTVTPTNEVNFGSVVRRYGCNINLSSGNVVAKGCGYYGFDVNITGAVTGTGIITATLYKNGKAITGATQSMTVETTGDTVALSFSAIDRITNCPCIDDEYSVAISGAITSISITNASIIVEKS